MELDFDIGQCFLCWHESKGANENYDVEDDCGGEDADADAEDNHGEAI